MIEVGDKFIIDGETGIVCYKGNFYNQDYICFSIDKDKFEIYKVKYQDGNCLFAKEKDEEKYAHVLAALISDSLDETNNFDNQIPEEFFE